MRILAAEDDLTSRLMLVAVLKKMGHDVVEAPGGKEAWDELQKPDAPRLVVLDWMMPDIEGIEICRRVRQIPTTDPPYVILLTAKDDVDSIVTGLNAGANDYLIKPYRIAELEARIGVAQRMLDLQEELNRMREVLAHEATHDSLTGALNRRAIYEALSHEFSRGQRKTSSFSVCLCDIDLFKQINDEHGHLAGDDVLKELVRTLQSNVRDYDMVGRYGGEEFLIVAPDPGGIEDNHLFERLRSVIAGTQFKTQAGSISVTISMGVARFTEERSIDELIAAADEALYRAKAGGRNRVVYAAGKEKVTLASPDLP